mgnify:CR=1 FL=1
MSRIRDKFIHYDTVSDYIADGKDIYDELDKTIDGQTEEEERQAERLADINRFLDDLPESTAKVLRDLLDSEEINLPIGEIARRAGVNRSTFFRNIRRAARRTWGTERPPFNRECRAMPPGARRRAVRRAVNTRDNGSAAMQGRGIAGQGKGMDTP